LLKESGKLFTWGSTDDMGQSYVTAGKHEVKPTYLLDLLLTTRMTNITNGVRCPSQETPEAFPLPSDVAIVRADAGWAHCVAITGIRLTRDAKLRKELIVLVSVLFL
jgi:hypothetical protein